MFLITGRIRPDSNCPNVFILKLHTNLPGMELILIRANCIEKIEFIIEIVQCGPEQAAAVPAVVRRGRRDPAGTHQTEVDLHSPRAC
jgi:hypothetical protein